MLNTINLNSNQKFPKCSLFAENFKDYVAHLQMHMALQAKNLVPNLQETLDERQELLHTTQAESEKLASRSNIISHH